MAIVFRMLLPFLVWFSAAVDEGECGDVELKIKAHIFEEILIFLATLPNFLMSAKASAQPFLRKIQAMNAKLMYCQTPFFGS